VLNHFGTNLRALTGVLAAILLTGCAMSPREPDVSYLVSDDNPPTVSVPALPAAPVVNPSARALVFDPPITAYTPFLNLDRNQRQPSASIGFESYSTSVTVTRQVDQQLFFPSNRGSRSFSGYLERHAVTQTVTVRSR